MLKRQIIMVLLTLAVTTGAPPNSKFHPAPLLMLTIRLSLQHPTKLKIAFLNLGWLLRKQFARLSLIVCVLFFNRLFCLNLLFSISNKNISKIPTLLFSLSEEFLEVIFFLIAEKITFWILDNCS